MQIRLAPLLCVALLSAGCGKAPVASAGPVRHYPIHGTVVGTNAETGEVEVNAAAIPGFMDAMTMPYRLKETEAMRGIHRGDQIEGTLDVNGEGTLLDGVKVVDATKEVRELDPKILAKPLLPGEAVPDFTLVNQSGKRVRLSDFHGKVLLVTFVYTHCPLSDYCPRMSRNFADMDKALAADPALYGATHLLSISFDPARDTPAALRSYGGAYTGRYTNETFAHWTFAVPPAPELPSLLEFFDVGSVPAPGNTLTHTLSTVEIGPDGHILKWFAGNSWTPEEVLADVKHNLGQNGTATGGHA